MEPMDEEFDAADLTWASPSSITPKDAIIYRDRTLTLWERFGVRFLRRRDPRVLYAGPFDGMPLAANGDEVTLRFDDWEQPL
jgi:hypothetical protein